MGRDAFRDEKGSVLEFPFQKYRQLNPSHFLQRPLHRPLHVPYTSPTRPLRPLQISPAWWIFVVWASSNEPSVMAELACAIE